MSTAFFLSSFAIVSTAVMRSWLFPMTSIIFVTCQDEHLITFLQRRRLLNSWVLYFSSTALLTRHRSMASGLLFVPGTPLRPSEVTKAVAAFLIKLELSAVAFVNDVWLMIIVHSARFMHSFSAGGFLYIISSAGVPRVYRHNRRGLDCFCTFKASSLKTVGMTI